MKLKSVPGGWYLHPFEIGVAGGSRERRMALVDMLIAELSREGFHCGLVTLDDEADGNAGSQAEARVHSSHTQATIPNGPRGPQTSLIGQSMATVDVLVVAGAEATALPTLMLFDDSAPERALACESLIAVVGGAKDARSARDAARHVGGTHVVNPEDREAILEAVRASMATRVAPVRGLVLAGGKSTRMGRDKASIEFTPGVSQARRTADLLSEVCDSVYVSARRDQALPEDVRHLPLITDRYDGLGPVGGMLSAYAHDPQAAWFVLGCDMPLLEEGDVRELFAKRNPYRLATCFATPADAPQGHVPDADSRDPDGPGGPAGDRLPREGQGSGGPAGDRLPREGQGSGGPGGDRLPREGQGSGGPAGDAEAGLGKRVSGELAGDAHRSPAGHVETGSGKPHAGHPGDAGHVPTGDASSSQPELLPEPLCAICEPKARTRMLTFLAEGVSCPRWMLMNGGADLILPSRPQAVYNANNPDDLARAAASAADAGNGGAAPSNETAPSAQDAASARAAGNTEVAVSAQATTNAWDTRNTRATKEKEAR